MSTSADLSPQSEQESYPSFTSTTLSVADSPTAKPTHKMTPNQDTSGHGYGPMPGRSNTLQPYSTLAQLSYAPATQTTVVTTTTTTTTTFPPMFLNAPRRLSDRDPKLYPLASSPTPQQLKRFRFEMGGRPTWLHEADDAEQTLRENLETHFETPSHLSRPQLPSGAPAANSQMSTTMPRKRGSSPVSIAEAAEIASMQRRSKKLRPAAYTRRASGTESGRPNRLPSYNISEILDETIPATPDTDTGSSGQLKIPRTRGAARKTNAKSPLSQSRSSRNGSLDLPAAQLVAQDSDGRNQRSRPSTSAGFFGSHSLTSDAPALTHLMDGYLPGVSATPPIAESDLEPILAFERDIGALQSARPSLLDTTSAADASLPSPSLSPTTAAAQLAQLSVPVIADSEDEDSNDVSSLDISHGHPIVRNPRHFHPHAASHAGSKIAIPRPTEEDLSNPQLPTPTQMDIPNMLNSFDVMPDELKTYVMYQFLRRCAKSTLHFVADVVNPALKCDFLGLLPLELSLNIVSYLDLKSMCRAAQVSKKWRHIINSDETAWKDLLEEDGYQLPDGELERAVREGWGWQYPHEPDSWERDLSSSVSSRFEIPESSPTALVSSGSSAGIEGDSFINPSSGRPKRKAAAKFSSNKKQRRKAPSITRTEAPRWSLSLDSSQGPIAHANAAAVAVPSPDVGLPSLKSLHLYKSLYHRHHLIRQGWMKENSKPHHIAFRAHQRHVVTCLQFDMDKILTGSDDTNINVYDTKTGALRKHLEGHEGGVWALQYEGDTLVSGSTDRSVRVWNIETGKCTQVFQGHTSTVRCLVILKPTKIGETAEGKPIIMPKEPFIITGSRDSSLRVWKLPGLNDRSIYQTGPPANDHDNPYFIRALTGHHHSVRAIAAHGDTLVSGSYDCTVRVWKISTGETTYRLQGHAQKVYSVVLDHARNRCISGSMDNFVKVWSLDTGACLFNLEGHTSLVGLLDLSHDRLVSAAADSTLRVWDPENGQCKSTLMAHTGAITCFQHDGQKVISGSDRTLKMWNIKTGECVKDLLTDLSGVWQVKFNERRCVAAVQRDALTYIEVEGLPTKLCEVQLTIWQVLDFGASRDGVPAENRGRRIVVDSKGHEVEDVDSEANEVEVV
ncbi:SCF ubiquitin ligase complex subunit cdc4 [Coniosporium tulheliwenetii]|uniref:SCF ubiquitin ligase complex subunit cdc4 n=1 Tax=Coniosporium tulheliwenetii TaxID=3383036 RepID=A0ACC2YIP2_9PEZI|nr:SCF ubiquitin ligase complex subunit cdc4 [Cladosporium sp. JES 115]